MSTKKTTTTKKPSTKSSAAKTSTTKTTTAKPATKASAAKKTADKATKSTTSKATQNSAPAKATTTSPAVRNTKAPAIKESKAPAIKESKVPAIKEAKLPVVQKSKSVDHVLSTNLGENPYLPHIATLVEVIEETANIKTFRIVIDDPKVMKEVKFGAGQVGQLSIFGVGEATFVISSPPSQKDYLQFSVMRVGEVTKALHKLSVGDKVGVRAPLGKPFPCEDWKGKDLFYIGGGIGMAPIRTIMLHTLENKVDYGKISLLYGARSPKDMAYNYELESWLKHKDLDCTLTIDMPFGEWEHEVGLIPDVLTKIGPDPKKSVAIICGPPIMIKFTVEALIKMNFAPENIITTLEKRMKCGIGICGRCNLGSKYVCMDGPVFSWAELQDLPPEL